MALEVILAVLGIILLAVATILFLTGPFAWLLKHWMTWWKV